VVGRRPGGVKPIRLGMPVLRERQLAHLPTYLADHYRTTVETVER
jgi:hypothetical protein